MIGNAVHHLESRYETLNLIEETARDVWDRSMLLRLVEVCWLGACSLGSKIGDMKFGPPDEDKRAR